MIGRRFSIEALGCSIVHHGLVLHRSFRDRAGEWSAETPQCHSLGVSKPTAGTCSGTVGSVSALTFRDATADDVLSIVRMYADDALGESREDASEPLGEGYLDAFHEIDADPRHRLVVVIQDGDIVGTLQLSFLPHLVLRGGRRAQIEAVRVRSDRRGTGLGKVMFEWAIEHARLGGCRLVQLTTNTDREDAHRFYAELGFEPTHIGMKLVLKDT